MAANELLAATEIFNTGKDAKVTPCIRYEKHQLAVGEVARRTLAWYLEFMAST